jgi:hypothetical protein
LPLNGRKLLLAGTPGSAQLRKLQSTDLPHLTKEPLYIHTVPSPTGLIRTRSLLVEAPQDLLVAVFGVDNRDALLVLVFGILIIQV